MPLHPGPFLSLVAALVTFVLGGFCGSPSNSLCYFYLRLSEPSQGLPQFFIRSYLDDQPITCYDSLTRKMEPLVPWMEEKETFWAPESIFRTDLEKLSKWDHHSGGLHTWQVILGCELKQNGSKGESLRYGYDGRDFISFEKETLRWVTAQPQAKKVKEKWEDDLGWSKRIKAFLEGDCIQWLERYLSYRKKSLEGIEPPVGKVTQKVVDDSLETLVCQAYGFYPKEIQATWTRDGENRGQETFHRTVAPNSDGTYYVWLSIEINPKERGHFQCHLEHEGLQEPLVLAFKEETITMWWISVGIVAATISGAGICFLICWWRKRRRKNPHKEGITCHDQNLPQSVISPSMDGTEDEMQSQKLLQTKIISEHKVCNRRQRIHSDSEIIVSSLRKREVKPHPKWKTMEIECTSPSKTKAEQL